MSCKGKGENDSFCVCEVIRKIAAAQNEVRDRKRGCEQSIQELMTTKKKYTHTTIPFILYKKGDIKPFIASSVVQIPIEGFGEESYYKCIESPIFKVKSVHNDQTCCATLELLRPVNSNGFPVKDQGEELCDFFQDKTPCKTVHFRETGICLTIDLSHFSGITCLAPITPLPKYVRKRK